MFLATYVGLFFDHQALDCCVAGLTLKRDLRVIASQRYLAAEKPSTNAGENLRYILQNISRDLQQPPDMVCAVLPPWETATIRIVLPRAARNYVERTIGYEIERHLPWSRDGVYYAIDSVRELLDDRLSVLCTALPKSRHLFYYEMLADAGLTPSFFLSTPYVLAKSIASMIPSPEAAFLVCIKALNRGIEFVCIEKGLPTYAYHLESGNDHQGARDTVHQEFSLFLDQAGLDASPQILVPLELEEWAKENELAEFGEVALYPDNACDLALGGLQAAVLGTPVEGSNLLPAELRRSRDKKPAWLATSLGIIGLLLFLAYIFSGLHGKSRQLDQLERMISEKKKLAQEVAGLKEENRKVGEQIRDLRSLLPPVSFLETLQSLTGTIPPLGWINEFTWNDQEVTLYGFAPSASDLLLLLEKSSLLREVSFVSPTQRVGDLEQFRIKGKLVENRPQEAEK